MNVRAHIRSTVALLAALVCASCCGIHEFPEPRETAFTLHLNFDQELPLYKEIEVETRSSNLYSRVSTFARDYDMRYIVEVYRQSNVGEFSRVAEQRVIDTKHEPFSPNHSIQLELTPGVYRFIVWADHVETGTVEDVFYDVSEFVEIKLTGAHHYGSNDMRDAFRGTVDCVFEGWEAGEATVEMVRPLAKYTFIATDLSDFVSRVLSLMNKKAQAMSGSGNSVYTDTRVIDLDSFKVVFRYTGFMPESYNLYTMKPADARTGVFFESSMEKLSADEASLGFDYVFVNGSEATVQVAVETYDSEGTLMSRTKSFDVPLVRSKHTIIRGKFLSQEASGSVGIKPDFDGEYNVEIP